MTPPNPPSRREFLKASAALALPVGGVVKAAAASVVAPPDAKPWHAELRKLIRRAMAGKVPTRTITVASFAGSEPFSYQLPESFKVKSVGLESLPLSLLLGLAWHVNGSEFCGAPPGTLMSEGIMTTRYEQSLTAEYSFNFHPFGWNNCLSADGTWKPVESLGRGPIYQPADFGQLP